MRTHEEVKVKYDEAVRAYRRAVKENFYNKDRAPSHSLYFLPYLRARVKALGWVLMYPEIIIDFDLRGDEYDKQRRNEPQAHRGHPQG